MAAVGHRWPDQGALEEALEQAYPLKERSLVCVDLDDPAASLTWNKGRVEWDGEAQLLTVGLTDEGRARPFVAGVVAAASARIGPAAASGGLIDGIPDDILASTASGPSPSRPVFQEATQLPADDEEVAVTMPRLQPVTASPPVEPGAPRVYRSEMSDHLRQSTQETVLAVHCPAGHVTPAYTPTCRVCHTTVPPQEPRRSPAQPRLLRLPTGEQVPLDRGVIFGRKPAPLPDSGDWPHLVHLPQDETYVSRMHLQIELDGWLVLARDLGSRGGTTLRVPGRLRSASAPTSVTCSSRATPSTSPMSTRSSTRSGRDRTPDPGVPVHRASRERGLRRRLPLRAGVATSARRHQGGPPPCAPHRP
ncbi:MAG: FHA domain-containing protein [Nocardioides sp.]